MVRTKLWWVLAALIVLATLGALRSTGASTAATPEAVQPVTATVVQPAPSPLLSCPQDHTTFGSVVKCDVDNAVGLSARWGDGRVVEITSDGSLDHRPSAVGRLSVELLDGESVIATHFVDVSVDLDVRCDDGPVTEIYELADDDRPEGWNYVYTNPDTGQRVLPGATDYPRDPGLTSYELVVLDEQPWTARCFVRSLAVDELGGTVIWHLSSAYQDEPLWVPIRNLWPFGKNYWNGVQPGEAVVTVTVGTVEVSERLNVYFAGCT